MATVFSSGFDLNTMAFTNTLSEHVVQVQAEHAFAQEYLPTPPHLPPRTLPQLPIIPHALDTTQRRGSFDEAIVAGERNEMRIRGVQGTLVVSLSIQFDPTTDEDERRTNSRTSTLLANSDLLQSARTIARDLHDRIVQGFRERRDQEVTDEVLVARDTLSQHAVVPPTLTATEEMVLRSRDRQRAREVEQTNNGFVTREQMTVNGLAHGNIATPEQLQEIIRATEAMVRDGQAQSRREANAGTISSPEQAEEGGISHETEQ